MLKGTVSTLPHRLGEKGSHARRAYRLFVRWCARGIGLLSYQQPFQDFVSHPGCSGPEIHRIGWAPSIQNTHDKRKSMRPSACLILVNYVAELQLP